MSNLRPACGRNSALGLGLTHGPARDADRYPPDGVELPSGCHDLRGITIRNEEARDFKGCSVEVDHQEPILQRELKIEPCSFFVEPGGKPCLPFLTSRTGQELAKDGFNVAWFGINEPSFRQGVRLFPLRAGEVQSKGIRGLVGRGG